VVVSLYSLRSELFSKLSKEVCKGLGFFLDGVSGFLRFTPKTSNLLELSPASSKNPMQDKTMLASGCFFFKKKDSLDDRAFNQKIIRLKQSEGFAVLPQSQELGAKAQIKRSGVLNYVKQKIGVLAKTNYGSTS